MNELAKALRILRIERGEVLKDMADRLGVTSSYLSAIECEKRKIPDDLIDKISELYNLNKEEKEKLEDAKAKTEKQIALNINLEKLNFEQQEIALKFARSFKEAQAGDMANLIEGMSRYFKNKEE